MSNSVSVPGRRSQDERLEELVKFYCVRLVEGCCEKQGLSRQRRLDDHGESLDIWGNPTVLAECLDGVVQVSGRRWPVVQVEIESCNVRLIA
jgi:hypothetical protein